MLAAQAPRFPTFAAPPIGNFAGSGAASNVLDICVDGRLIDTLRTGVCHYSSCLAGTLSDNGTQIVRLDAELPSRSILEGRAMDRARRIASALRLHSRRTRHVSFEAIASGGEVEMLRVDRLMGADIFREARLHFRLYKRLMPIETARPPRIMHWTYPVPLYMKGALNVYTIHDVIPLLDAGLSPIKAKFHERLIRRIARRADRLLTVSETVRQQLIAMLGCSPDFVVNTWQAVQIGEPARVPPMSDRSEYFLACGSIEPRKNLERLVEAYRRSGTSRKLIIAGPDGWQADRVKRRIAEVPGVELMPFQSRQSILSLIKNARALLFPSLAEGFGLPVAEAMALGTPVMASHIPTMEEITRGAALLVDPINVDSMQRGINRLCEDDAFCDDLKQRGVAASAEYHPNKYYERLHAIYAALTHRDLIAA